MSSKEYVDVLVNRGGGHQGGIAKDDVHTSDNLCSNGQVDLLPSRKDTPHLDVVESEVQFNHMKDNVDNLSQLKYNDLREANSKEANSKEANTKEVTGHNYGDGSFPSETFDEDKSDHESQSSADRDKTCTSLKKVSLSVHSGGSNDDVDKYGSNQSICDGGSKKDTFENKPIERE
eukprot:5228103-Ditylum_brightwellii.AAC.1